MISVIVVEIWGQKLLELGAVPHPAGELIQRGAIRATSDVVGEILFDAQDALSFGDIVNVDGEPQSMVTEPPAPGTAVRVSSGKSGAGDAVRSEDWLEFLEGHCEATVELKWTSIAGPKNDATQTTLYFDGVFHPLQGIERSKRYTE
jgi:hypothetical protein